MRISTSMVFQSGLAKISDLQSSMLKTQQQISTNRRILTPSDDPVAASRVLNISQSKAINDRLTVNRQDARSALEAENSALTNIKSVLQDVQQSVVQAGNPTYDDTQRKFLATDISNHLDSLISLANSRDAEGKYLFSGYQTQVEAFKKTVTGVQYMGDQGARSLQVGQLRQMQIADSGNAIFNNIPATNSFGSVAAATNTGNGAISPGSVSDSTQLTGHNYSIDISGGGTSYSVYDLTNDPGKSSPIASGAYGSGQPITFDGLTVKISGAPVDGDSFTVQPAATQDMFTTLSNLVSLLNTPVSGAAAMSTLNYGLKAAGDNLNQALSKIETMSASIGSRLNELDSLDTGGSDLDVQYQASITNLQSVDLVQAISDLTQQKTTLDAAQQSFVKISGLSLFNYIT